MPFAANKQTKWCFRIEMKENIVFNKIDTTDKYEIIQNVLQTK